MEETLMKDVKEYEELFERQFDRVLRLLVATVAGLFACVAIGVLCGCRTQYVPVETVRTEIQRQTDTVRVTDSVRTEKETIVREARPEDSVLLARLGLKLKENDRTILVLQKELERERSLRSEQQANVSDRSDTVQVPYPVERELTAWERGQMYCVGFVGGLGLVGVAGAALWLRRRYKRC